MDGIFNLHGLWPDRQKDYPQNCKEIQFQEYNYNSFVKENIDHLWNSYYNPNWGFIQHELEKHGSCWNMDYGKKPEMDVKVVNLYN